MLGVSSQVVTSIDGSSFTGVAAESVTGERLGERDAGLTVACGGVMTSTMPVAF